MRPRLWEAQRSCRMSVEAAPTAGCEPPLWVPEKRHPIRRGPAPPPPKPPSNSRTDAHAPPTPLRMQLRSP